MEAKNKNTGWIVIGGALGFILIVICLHIVQPDYDPVNQLMSELALGRHGSFMLLAFSSFALSVFTAQSGLHQHKSPTIIRLFLVIAAISLLGAGVFRVGRATELHIILVAIAFVQIVLVMFLLPRNVSAFKTPTHTLISWTLGVCTATCVALGQNVVPVGAGQRGAALCILIWLVWVGYSLIRMGGLKGA
jgi:peptidoglycan/LPS O-acetylase OafA/YrhL